LMPVLIFRIGYFFFSTVSGSSGARNDPRDLVISLYLALNGIITGRTDREKRGSLRSQNLPSTHY
jgi:hypothetical protein